MNLQSRKRKVVPKMKSNRRILIGLLTGFLILLAACGNSDESNTAPKNEVEETNGNTPEQDSTEESSDDTEVETPKNEEDPISDEESLKEDYLKKLNEAKKEMDALQPTDSSTYAMKNLEGERYDVWDGLLNEIYQVLEQQLSADEMEQLRIEQREWITHRDNSAKEASLKFEGGTQEQLEYVIVLNRLTEERCFELVEDYMK